MSSEGVSTGKTGRAPPPPTPAFPPPSPSVLLVNKTRLLRHSSARVADAHLFVQQRRVSYPPSGLTMLHVKPALALTRASGSPLLRPLVPRRARATVTSAQASVSGRTGGGGHDAPVRPVRPGKAGRDSAAAAAGPGVVSVSFEQTREAYRSKDSLELLRSLVVFKLCSYDFLVERNQEVRWCRFTAQPGVGCVSVPAALNSRVTPSSELVETELRNDFYNAL